MRFLVVVSYLVVLACLAAFLLIGQPGLSGEILRGGGGFDADRAMAHLRRIDELGGLPGGRAVGSAGNARVRAYLAREFAEAGLAVQDQTFKDLLGGAMSNVIATLPGDRRETILICGHHDAEGTGPAAVDGAAGLAVLLELARAVAASEKAPESAARGPSRTVVFASWDGEAYGCAGSTHFVGSLPTLEKQALRAVVSLDSIGWRHEAAVLHVLPYRDRFGVSSVAPDWLVTRMSNAARARGTSLPIGDPYLGLVYQVLVRVIDVGYYSDDRPFLAKGVPAVFVSNLSITRSYSRSGTVGDTIDQVGRDQVASAGRSLEAALTDLAGADRLPVGEPVYLVLRLPFFRASRLTGDQLRTLVALSLLPGAVALIRRRRGDRGLALARALFFAFGAILVLAVLRGDPIVFSALFLPALLAGPLLALRSPKAAWGHLVSLAPPFLLALLVAPVYLTGSAPLVRMAPTELAVIALLAGLGLAQAPLHFARLRVAAARRDLPPDFPPTLPIPLAVKN